MTISMNEECVLAAAAYDQLAERWTDERYDATYGIEQHERALSFAKGGGHFLNVGCGCNGRINTLLRSRGFEVEGLDVSQRMIELARASDPQSSFHHADICTWQPTRRYDFISAWDSIWHIPLEQQRPVMAKLMASLEDDGVMILSAGGLNGPSEHRNRTMGPDLYYSTLGIPGLLEAIADAGCICRHLEFDQWPEEHLYVIAQRMAANLGEVA